MAENDTPRPRTKLGSPMPKLNTGISPEAFRKAEEAAEIRLRNRMIDAGVLKPDGTPVLDEHGKPKQYIDDSPIDGLFDGMEIAAGRRTLQKKTTPEGMKP